MNTVTDPPPLPGEVAEPMGATDCPQVENSKVQRDQTLTRAPSGDELRLKLAERSVSPQDVDDAVTWARRAEPS